MTLGDTEEATNHVEGEKEPESTTTTTTGNPAWADAMKKILNVKAEKPENVILSKRRWPKATDDSEADAARTTKKQAADGTETKLARKQWNEMCRVKPTPLHRERERRFAKIATKGVVQLFNAVEQHQKKLRAQLQSAGPCESQKDKTLAACGENLFLDVLNRQRKVKKEAKSSDDEGDSEEEKPRKGWKVLSKERPEASQLGDWNSDSDSD